MNKLPHNVDWYNYAQTYDLLMAYNPFYQQLHREVLAAVGAWEVEEGDLLLDLGAGTGNYSVELAKRFPRARVWHVELNRGMNALARQKKEQWGLDNLRILAQSVHKLDLEPGSVKGCISIHALYTFPDPKQLLSDIFGWTQADGYGLFVNPGRPVRVLDWQLAIGWHLLRQYGWRKTLELMRRGREISRQNREIRKAQADGAYWTHSHEEFCTAVATAGLKIKDTRYCFRGISDWVETRREDG